MVDLQNGFTQVDPQFLATAIKKQHASGLRTLACAQNAVMVCRGCQENIQKGSQYRVRVGQGGAEIFSGSLVLVSG